MEKDVKYTCPMHPEVISDKEGMCPECGMQLVVASQKHADKHRDGNKDRHEGHSTNIFKVKFWVSLVLSIPIVVYAEVVQELLGFRAPQFPGSEYLPFVLGSVIFFYGGWVFISSAYRELKAKMPGMMTLISLAITVAYVYSVFVTFLIEGSTLYWELATLITVMLLGHWIEMRAVSGAQGALKELSKLLPDTAEVVQQTTDNKQPTTKIVPTAELKKGDLVLVKPGGRIPADGVVKEGISDVDESIVTGESKSVGKKDGDEVIAGTINGDGSLTVEVSNVGEETFLAGVARLVSEAQASKSRLQTLSDRAAFYLTIVAVVVGATTFATWLALSDTSFAVTRMVAVLVIACPHALGLAIPLVASISTTKAASNGFLVKQRLALEAARNIDTVLFDKTGTLTKGEFAVTEVTEIPNKSQIDAEKMLQLAASVEQHSEHSIAKAIVAEARKKNIELFEVKDFKAMPGKGVRGVVNGQEINILQASEDKGPHTRVEVLIEKDKLGEIALEDVVREESREAIKALHGMGIKTAMITGDSEEVAAWVANELGIDEHYARVLPGEKAEIVRRLQNLKSEIKNSRKRVAFVGDGVNDAPALAQADLGIAIGAGTNVAIESAGIILVRNDPRDIVKIINLSQMTYVKMIQNLFWAAGYNVIAIPLAAGVLAFKGILLQPAVAAVLMSASTVIVAVNAVLLKRRKMD